MIQGNPWEYRYLLCWFQGIEFSTHDIQPWLEQPRLLRFEIRLDMKVIIKPPCHRIAAEHHEFPDIIGIG
jgi:hypothetical protein